MKILKHFLFSALLFIGLSYSVSAQDILSDEHQQEIAENVSSFMQNLNLSERDKPAFRNIMSDFFVGLIALRSTDFSLATNKKVIKKLIKERDARVKDLLSGEQNKVYKTRVKERQSQIKNFIKEQR